MAHTVDVDAMLESMEPWQFDEWQAEHDLEPWGDDWKQAGTIAAVLENSIAAIIAAIAGGETPRPARPRDYYRKRTAAGEEKQLRYLTAEEQLAKDRMLCGV